MTIEEMEKRWPDCPPNKCDKIFFGVSGTTEYVAFEPNQNTIKEIREYLDAVEESMND